MGKMMKKAVIFGLVATSALFGIDDSVGVREYKAHCKECHGTAGKGAAMRASFEWSAIFDNNAKELLAVHSNNDKATQKLKSEKFLKDSSKILEFLKNNASDTGNVRGCSGASCG